MIKLVEFVKDYDLVLEKETQRRFPTKRIDPSKDRYSREKNPYEIFYLFKKGLNIKFHEGVNVIVGENGSGKTTLFGLLKDYSGKPYDKTWGIFNEKYDTEEKYFNTYQDDYKGCLKVDGELHYKNSIYFSAEHDNPVVAIPKMLNPDSRDFMSLTAQLFDAQEESHGESMMPVLKYLLGGVKDCVIFMDEPDTALSLKNQFWLANLMKKSVEINNNQVIIATHALALINQFETIFDMETRMWVNRKKYVEKTLLNAE